jgi:flagellar biosynthetic protein FliR
MQFDAAMASFAEITKYYQPYLDGLLLLFCRILAFLVAGPIFNRKNLPFMLKLSAAFFLTGTMAWILTPARIGNPEGSREIFLLFPIITNVTVGMLIGFIASMLLETLSAAGGLMNSQIGLSAAAMMDPTTGRQTQVMETLLNYLGTVLFIQIGGMYWTISALRRSLDVFPLFDIKINIVKTISLPYIIDISSTILQVGVQLIAPAMIVTIAMDVMLGIVNKTAQQMPVFQLSAALKPAIGIGITLVTLTTFLEALSQYFYDYSKIF